MTSEIDRYRRSIQYDCIRCWRESGGIMRSYMITCPTCHNKRCPKASDHRLACTHSNEPGQPGSEYR